MKLIVGLGNPGKEYESTRHNCGFMAIDYFACKRNIVFKNKMNGLYAETIINNEKVILLKPLSYMNSSGSVVSSFANYYQVDLKDILIIYDDVDFELGTFKIKKNGSAGGHNGIKDVIKSLSTENINRIRIGVSKNKSILRNYVLKKMSKKDLELINRELTIIDEVIEMFMHSDIDKIMNIYNTRDKDEK